MYTKKRLDVPLSLALLAIFLPILGCSYFETETTPFEAHASGGCFHWTPSGSEYGEKRCWSSYEDCVGDSWWTDFESRSVLNEWQTTKFSSKVADICNRVFYRYLF